MGKLRLLLVVFGVALAIMPITGCGLFGDTRVRYTHVKADFYKDKNNIIYYQYRIADGEGSLTYLYKATMPLKSLDSEDSLTNFIDLETYSSMPGCGGYARDKNHVYFFITNSDGTFMRILEGADSQTITYYQELCFVKDKNTLYFNHAPVEGFETDSVLRVIRDKEFDPYSTHAAYSTDSFYFTDEIHVFYGNKMLAGADPKTFVLVNSQNWDACDKNSNYFKGELVPK